MLLCSLTQDRPNRLQTSYTKTIFWASVCEQESKDNYAKPPWWAEMNDSTFRRVLFVLS